MENAEKRIQLKEYLSIVLAMAEGRMAPDTEVLEEMLGHMEGLSREKGLISAVDISDYCDGSAESDVQSTGHGVDCAVNLLFCGVLKLAAQACDDKWKVSARVMEARITDSLFDRKLGLFRDAAGSMHHSVIVNSIALSLGILPRGGDEQVRAYVQRKKTRK